VSDTKQSSALAVQVGGDHYRKLKIQPVEYITQNNIGFLEGCIIKRATRWRDKDGIRDLEKIVHEAQLLIEQEKKRISELSAVAKTVPAVEQLGKIIREEQERRDKEQATRGPWPFRLEPNLNHLEPGREQA
jgi:hypothetical protein